MEAAIAALESLKPGEKRNITKTAKEYGVGRDALARRIQGVQGPREAQYQNQRLLSAVQEKRLIQYINKLCLQGLPPTKQII